MLSLNDCTECHSVQITMASMSDLRQTGFVLADLKIAISNPVLPFCSVYSASDTLFFISELKAMQVTDKVCCPEKVQYCFCFECLLPPCGTLD